MLQEYPYMSPFFSLKMKQSDKLTTLTMQLFIPCVNTKDLPHTKQFLTKNFPSVLKTECFNDKNLPFFDEVNETEIGHLFEHILLDQLCILKIQSGASFAVFNGNTSWDWQTNPYGMFEILVDIGKKECKLLMEALRKTVELTELLIEPVFQAFSTLVTNFRPYPIPNPASLMLPTIKEKNSTGNLTGGYP